MTHEAPKPLADTDAPRGPGVWLDAPAPDFEARATTGPVRLADFRGQWLVFFSHPADFTPVCTSEFVKFQQLLEAFEARNAALLGLSVDSLYAHIAWISDIEQRFGVRIGFPIIEDISMSVARAYGMIHDASTSTATVRSLFIIDPQGVVRAAVHYPMNVGRSVDEVLRVLSALQESDANEVSTPEGWRPGADALLPPPANNAEAALRNGGPAWYFTPVRQSDES